MADKEKHLAALLELAPDERLAAANALLDSLDAESTALDWETAWAAELTRRLDALCDGTREPIAAEEVFAEARARLESSGA